MARMSRAWAVLPAAALVVLGLWVPVKVAVSYSTYDGAQVQGPTLSEARYAGPAPSNGTDELAVFLHVSDIHLSKFSPKQEENLEAFCANVVGAVGPKAVFATGDLVDGYGDSNRRGGGQQLSEWVTYRDVLQRTGMLDAPGMWFDTRGNHDTYGSGRIDDPETNLYERFGVSSALNRGGAQTSRRAWSTEFAVGSSVLRVVALDASIGPGVSKPFNFYGALDGETREAVLDLLSASPEPTQSLLIGHHPESQILGGLGSAIRERSSYYLCGHIHSATMKHRVGDGMIELEVDDMVRSQGYRLMAFDHGAVSFAELVLDDGFPISLVTNPKDARYLSVHEPSHTATSTHVRVLAYTSAGASISAVDVVFDGAADHPANGRATAVDGSTGLYVLRWEPAAHFATGLHTIQVTITDSEGRSRVDEHQFSLDGATGKLGKTRVQVEQAFGDTSAVFRAMLVAATFANALFLFRERAVLLAALPVRGLGAGRLASPSQRALSWFLAVSVPWLAVGPFAVGFFVSSDGGPLCLVFPFGIAVIGQGFAQDPQAMLFAALMQVAIVLPALLLLAAQARSAASALPLEGKFSVHVVRQRARCGEGRGPAARLAALAYLLLLMTGVLSLMLGTQTDHVAPLFLSPAVWFVFGVVGFVLRMMGDDFVQGDWHELPDSGASRSAEATDEPASVQLQSWGLSNGRVNADEARPIDVPDRRGRGGSRTESAV